VHAQVAANLTAERPPVAPCRHLLTTFTTCRAPSAPSMHIYHHARIRAHAQVAVEPTAERPLGSPCRHLHHLPRKSSAPWHAQVALSCRRNIGRACRRLSPPSPPATHLPPPSHASLTIRQEDVGGCRTVRKQTLGHAFVATFSATSHHLLRTLPPPPRTCAGGSRA
jgi:hypothetical protein